MMEGGKGDKEGMQGWEAMGRKKERGSEGISSHCGEFVHCTLLMTYMYMMTTRTTVQCTPSPHSVLLSYL